MKFTRKEWLLLFALAAINFSHIVDFMIMMPLGPQLMRIFEITPRQFSLLVSIYTISAGISGFIASMYIDRFDRKRTLLMFYVFFTVGTFACAVAGDYFLLLLARGFTGFFGGILGSLVMAIVADNFSYEKRGSAMGIVMGAFSIASVFGVPMGLYLAQVGSWHTPFVALGGVGVLLSGMILIFIPSMRSHLLKNQVHATPVATLQKIFSSPSQRLALLFLFFLVMGQFSIIPFISPSMVINAGLPENQLAFLYLFGGICSMFASPFFGRLSDKIGKQKVFAYAAIGSMVPIVLITHLGPSPVWFILTVSSVFFISMSGRMVPAMTIVSASTGPETRGSFMSIASCTQQLSAGLASWMAGLIITTDEAGHLLHYDLVGFLALTASFFALIIVYRLKTPNLDFATTPATAEVKP